MLFAEASGGSFNFVLFMLIMFIGFRKIGSVLKSNDKLRKSVWQIIFRK
ncbi:MAG: GlyGly-CTERM sorting domain-containing protein [Gemmataceae bacterium]